MTDATLSLFEYGLKLGGGQQSLVSSKRKLFHATPLALCTQTMTTLGSTTGQYLTTVFSGHTGAESVSTLTLQIAGLKGSFHVSNALNQFQMPVATDPPSQKRRNSTAGQARCQCRLPAASEVMIHRSLLLN